MVEQLNQEFMDAINKIANDILNPPASQTKGTGYWYYAGYAGKGYRVAYTKNKTHYKGKYGFWSWLETYYKTKKVWKRTKFVYSGSRKSCEKRANKLLEKTREVHNGDK